MVWIRRLSHCSVTFATAWLVSVGHAQATLHRICGPALSRLGSSARSVGDANGDGFAEFAAIQWGRSVAQVWSGRDGVELFRTNVGNFRSRIVPAGDIDGDGHADVLVYSIDVGVSPGAARVYSGRTWSLIRSWAQHDGGAGLGDSNGDGFDDVALSTGGVVTVYAGPALTPLYAVPGASVCATPPTFYCFELAESVARLGDVDGDSLPDFAVSTWGDGAIPATIGIHRGIDGALLYTLAGSAASEWFGIQVVDCGDWDDDGCDDFCVSAPGRGAGFVTFYSGRSGAMMFERTAQSPHSDLGRSLGRAGDVNADGVMDVIASTRLFHGNPTVLIYGFEVFAGPDGRRLHFVTNPPGRTNSFFGAEVDGAGDLDGDGFDDVLIGSRFDGVGSSAAGCVYVLSLNDGATRRPGSQHLRGAACSGSGSRLPRIGFEGRAELGLDLTLTMRGARPNTGAVLHIGDPVSLPVDVIGLIGCTLYSVPLFTVGSGTDGLGRARVEFGIPVDLAPVGHALEFQWAIWDPGANALGVTLSDAVSTRLGEPPVSN